MWWKEGKEGDQTLRAHLSSSLEHPCLCAAQPKLPGPLIGDPMLGLVREIFLILFHFIERLPSPPPYPESGLRIIGSFFPLMRFYELCSRCRNIWTKQERKEEKKEGGRGESWSLSSLPVEGRACEESLGYNHISRKNEEMEGQPIGAQERNFGY